MGDKRKDLLDCESKLSIKTRLSLETQDQVAVLEQTFNGGAWTTLWEGSDPELREHGIKITRKA